jgi:hypothetical protein
MSPAAGQQSRPRLGRKSAFAAGAEASRLLLGSKDEFIQSSDLLLNRGV